MTRPLGQGRDEPVERLGKPAHHRIRERDGPLALGGAHELDRVVDHGVHRLIRPRQLVRTHTERCTDGRIELSHPPLPDLLDPEVDRPRSLHRAVGEPLGEGTIAVVEAGDRRVERAIRVRVLLEDATHHLERGAARRRDHRTPRRNSSYAIWLRPSG